MKVLALCVLLIAAALPCAFAQNSMTMQQPLVRVKLNPSKPDLILVKELRNRVETYQKQTKAEAFSIDDKKQILEALIDEKLVIQAATKEGMSLTGTQVDQLYQSAISQMVGKNVTEAEFAEIVKANYKMTVEQLLKEQVGMSLADYKVYLKNQYLARNYVMSKKSDEIKKAAEPTKDEIDNYYSLNESSLVQPETLKLFIAIVPKGSDASASKAKILKIYDDYKNKKLKDEQMRTESQKTDSTYKVGDMFIGKTEIAARQLGMSYANLLNLFKENSGYISDVIENNNEWYFFVITKKFPKKALELMDSVQPESNVTVYEYIKNTLAQQKQQQAFLKAIQEVTKELNTPQNVERLKTGADLDKLLNW